MNLPPGSAEGIFVKRLNRFVGVVRRGSRTERVYIPNTGRLSELLLPGREVILLPSAGTYRHKLAYVLYQRSPVLIESIRSNEIVRQLIHGRLLPGLEDTRVLRSEAPWGRHRFDLQVERDGIPGFLEVKSCTLAWRGIASFPDAVSERAASHIQALAESGNGTLVFLNMHQGVRHFVPNYHTDYAFYETLRDHRDRIDIRAYAVRYNESLQVIGASAVPLTIPVRSPSGAYMLLLRSSRHATVSVGALGPVTVHPGFYLYTGSGRNNVFKRIEHHRRPVAKPHWHLDYTRAVLAYQASYPIVTDESLECRLSQDLAAMGGTPLPGFGCTDCTCESHLYYFTSNPASREDFWEMLLAHRYQRSMIE